MTLLTLVYDRHPRQLIHSECILPPLLVDHEWCFAYLLLLQTVFSILKEMSWFFFSSWNFEAHGTTELVEVKSLKKCHTRGMRNIFFYQVSQTISSKFHH